MVDEIKVVAKPDGQVDNPTQSIVEDKDKDLGLSAIVVEEPGTGDEPKGNEPIDEKPIDQTPGNTDSGLEDKTKIDPVQKKINKFVYEKKAAEERAEAERQKRLEAEAKLAEATKEELPEIPAIPDYMDKDFDQKIKDRDAIIIKHAEKAANEQVLNKIREDQATADRQQELETVKNSIKKFDDRTEELKLDKETLLESQNVVGNFLTGKKDLARYLLADENGPLNVLYLSQNAPELERISKMPETEAAVYIATQVAPKALELKPKTTNTPDPVYVPNGKSKTEMEDPNLEGCTFT